MRFPRQRYFIPSLAVLLAIGFSGSMTTSTSALSLGDVTNALGGVLGLNTKQNETAQTSQKETTPPAQAQTVPTQPAQAQSTLAQAAPTTSEKPATAAPAAPRTSAAPVTNVEQVTPATRDTGAIVQQVASAQTSKSIAPVTYSSKQISSELRDELFAVAAVITIVGAATYAMTYTTSSRQVPSVSRRPLYVK